MTYAKIIYGPRIPLKKLTQEELDNYEKQYLQYAQKTWQKAYDASISDTQAKILYKALLSPFQYWLIDQIQIENIEKTK